MPAYTAYLVLILVSFTTTYTVMSIALKLHLFDSIESNSAREWLPAILGFVMVIYTILLVGV